MARARRNMEPPGSGRVGRDKLAHFPGIVKQTGYSFPAPVLGFRPGAHTSQETPVSDRDLCFVPATALQRLYRTRRVSPLELMQAVLARIDAVNPRVNAYVTVVREAALAEARKATAALRRRATLPPLHGIPVSIKDLTDTKGIRTTWGSKIYEHHVPDADA